MPDNILSRSAHSSSFARARTPRVSRSTLAITILFAFGVAAEAQSRRCRITDPTGTPLNVRATPGGEVVGQLPNGMLVNRAETVRDDRGRTWLFLHNRETGDPIGWVYREFVACF